MIDVTTLTAAVERVASLKKAQAAAFADMIAARKLLAETEQAYNRLASDHAAAEAHLVKLAGINTRGIAKRLELQSARYTKSDVRV